MAILFFVQNSYFVRITIMKSTKAVLILLVLFSTIAYVGCSSQRSIGGSSKKCGCGINKGMVGY